MADAVTLCYRLRTNYSLKNKINVGKDVQCLRLHEGLCRLCKLHCSRLNLTGNKGPFVRVNEKLSTIICCWWQMSFWWKEAGTHKASAFPDVLYFSLKFLAKKKNCSCFLTKIFALQLPKTKKSVRIFWLWGRGLMKNICMCVWVAG